MSKYVSAIITAASFLTKLDMEIFILFFFTLKKFYVCWLIRPRREIGSLLKQWFVVGENSKSGY